MAGLTVAAVALPLALAFGVSSGATAAAGLVTAIIAGLVIGAFSGGFYQISGPTGAMAAILMSVIAGYGLQGVFAATLIAGVLLVLCGIFHIGRLTSFIPAPVITGFTSGIAVIIAMGQIDNFFGVASEGSSAVQKLFSYGRLGFPVNLQAVLLGMFVVLFMVFPEKMERGGAGFLSEHYYCHSDFCCNETGCGNGGRHSQNAFPGGPSGYCGAESPGYQRAFRPGGEYCHAGDD